MLVRYYDEGSVMSKLDEWAALAEKAMPGPWTWSVVGYQEPDAHVLRDADNQTLAILGYDEPSYRAVTFIAASRTAVPTLVAALRAIETLCQVADYNDGLISTEYIRTIRDAALGENNV